MDRGAGGNEEGTDREEEEGVDGARDGRGESGDYGER